MSFDDETRSALAKMVATCRRHLSEDVTDQLQRTFGLYPDGTILPSHRLELAEDEKAAAEALRELLNHFAAGEGGRAEEPEGSGGAEERRRNGYDRLVLEISFTALNRLAALRLCEERELIVECVRKGTASDGFRLFERVSGGALGTRYETYKVFLDAIFDELALDLGVLFDRTTPQSALFPSERCLENVLAELNDQQLTHLWAADETIGWIYQYFNPPEERAAMRDASQAPRNSRELAVRNQFFTPRYVVEFLTDNTLGRIWFEMRKGDTALKEECRYLARRPHEIFLGPGESAPASENVDQDLTPEELLSQPVYIEHRPSKDPRDLRVLDPACGSGHFLLYAFDLLERIYEEGWQDPDCPRSEAVGRTLREDFETLNDLRRAVARLVIEHNLHGIDIDPRAVQIAALALWLRAQKTWKALSLKPAKRPRIERSNIVVAEYMPGEDDMRREFTAGLKPRVLGQLLDAVFDRMRLAGEAGSILKIAEEIREAVAAAKVEYVADQRRSKDEGGYLAGMERLREATFFDFSDVAEHEFWDQAEALILAALKSYAERAENGLGVRRRLFAKDAARGFAFIDLCGKQYDVVLMNPPFGNPASGSAAYLATTYPEYGGDIMTAFLSRGIELSAEGLTGAIASRAPFYLPTYGPWRKQSLGGHGHLAVIADLGADVLDDALVEAFCCAIDTRVWHYIPSFRLNRDSSELKPGSLLEMVEALRQGKLSKNAFFPSAKDIFAIPGAPMVYSAARQLSKTYREGIRISPSLASVEQGLSTKDDFRYLRLAIEVPVSELDRSRWGFIAKGGEYRPFYDDIHLVVKAHDAFRELSADLIAKYPYLNGDPAWVLHPESQYFIGGLTYPERTTSAFAPRVLPRDCYFSHVGLGIIGGSEGRDIDLLAWLLSRPVQLQIELQVGSADAVESGSAARHYSKGLVEGLAIPRSDSLHQCRSQVLAAVALARSDFETDELSRVFRSPWGVQSLHEGLTGGARACFESDEAAHLQLIRIQDAVEEHAERAFCIQDEELLDTEVRRRVCALPKTDPADADVVTAYSIGIDNLVDITVARCGAHRSLSKKAYIADRRLELAAFYCGVHPESVASARRRLSLYPDACAREYSQRMLQYAVGVALGRWDLQVALDRFSPDIQLDAFSPLPQCSPGMLTDAQSPYVTKGALTYPLTPLLNGLLVGDTALDGRQPHQDDIVRRVREVFDLLWNGTAHVVEQEACALLGCSDLGQYFHRPTGFFQDHLNYYSKSRRRAPIYWPLSTASGSYTLWVYYHALTDQTLYTAVNKYLEPKLTEMERAADTFARDLETTSGREATQLRDRLNEARSFSGELRDLREELLRIASLPYKPNLNDGVIINAAPFYRLFRLRSWSKDAEQVWNKLEKGDYDWTHLAYTVWPDRVKDTCRRDRSIAIALGLEQLCEVESPPAKGRGQGKGRKTKKVGR